jgi:hypothetical protein
MVLTLLGVSCIAWERGQLDRSSISHKAFSSPKDVINHEPRGLFQGFAQGLRRLV